VTRTAHSIINEVRKRVGAARPLIYEDFTREEIDAIVDAPDFESIMAEAMRNMATYMLEMQRAVDKQPVSGAKS
jgi:hypothetical protein